MSTETGLESPEDLENVPAARMEDVQPQGRSSETYKDVLKTFVDDEYEECLVEDDDSNIGSMVSIQSEEVVECDESAELIVPEVLASTNEVSAETEDLPKTEETVSSKQNRPDSWPTLEILPGGVINSADKNDVTGLVPNMLDRDAVEDTGDMMYACAKCSQSFKYLFCLVKHVKWHEEEAKRGDLTRLTSQEKELVLIRRARLELERTHKKQKLEVYSRIAESLGRIDNFKEIFD